ncbi:cytochrome c biogenesis protein CcsA [Meiothermus granaticius]|uniref:Heme exporter protein C n=1 Tax=Meiothermus granaticius NBRC 107808 TaxID=1227551 RepID=A0A399F934_9DEIN|nr:cytochrome c biogenesis protein CcsA [Meiothermus granaticius]MCL6525861.1 cytochrome c biogenesis protein CcsA [Thermaceae bacterium]RIH92205.1 Heme exporter protein C [Meiothermus granaticius NBRC 107808]GEM85617.1 cytochrome c biogenesis protein [Meiothermus granaticius NBRC 107808]
MQLTRSSGKRDGLTPALLAGGLLGLLVGFYLALSAPPDVNQGWLVRIMYLHVPMAWLCYLAIFGTLGYSIAYLVRRNPRYDRMAAASAELGLLFSALTVLSGALWGRPTWGVYWTWEPRLTTFAILIAVYVGYFVVRSAIEDPELRANASAAIGILGSINVPISYMSVKWWRSLHQTQTIDLTTGKVNMEPSMLLALMVNLLAFTLLYIAFVRLRGIIAEREAEKLEAQHG